MITIVDYQMGNLHSVQKAFERVGYAVRVCQRAEEIAAAEKLVLPGVGAFGRAMQELRQREMVEPLRDFIRSGRPFLGICLGLQLLFESSSEGGEQSGLGLIPGRVERLTVPPPFKVPHMGWNQVQIERTAPILEGVPHDSHFYFVHSYYVLPRDSTCVALTCTYHLPFCAMIWHENIQATQFHPEKSQAVGLQLIENFAAG